MKVMFNFASSSGAFTSAGASSFISVSSSVTSASSNSTSSSGFSVITFSSVIFPVGFITGASSAVIANVEKPSDSAL